MPDMTLVRTRGEPACVATRCAAARCTTPRYMAHTRGAICTIVLFLIAVFSCNAVADDKRCFQAGNAIEIKDCLRGEFYEINKELEQTYKKIRKGLTSDAGKVLDEAQEVWIQFRDKDCRAVYELLKAGTIRTTKALVCRIEKTRGRIAELQKWPASGPNIAKSACLPYEPTEVTLVGVVHFKTFAGPPNYRSIPSGDRAERVALLELKEPICVRGKSADPINVPRNGITAVQLVITSGSPVTFVEGRKVAARGTLFGSHAGHHRTPVLLQVRVVKDAI